MTIPTRLKRLFICMLLCSGSSLAQGLPWLDAAPVQTNLAQPVDFEPGLAIQNFAVMAPVVATTTAPSTVTIPAGTRVMMVLESPLHTTSGTAGSGIYLQTLFPVIQDGRVVIPAHTRVQGVVEANQRPGHLKRTSGFRFRFNSLIFSDNHVATITGALQSIPGAKNIRTQDQEGTLRTVDQPEKVIIPTAASSVGGAIIGSQTRFGIGKFTGAGLGAALGLGAVLLKRGDEISLAQGMRVEMVLQAPLSLEQAQIEANARSLQPPSGLAQPVDHPPASCDAIRMRRQPRQLRPFGLLAF